jgi:DNA-binding CsgD family transcriptional regulator
MWKENPAALVAGAYDAALRDEYWSDWSLRLFEAMGGMGGTAFLIDSSTHALERAIAFRTPAQAAEQYIEGFWMHDPQVGIAASFQGLGSYRDTHDADISAPETQDYLRWQASVAGFRHNLSAIVPLGGNLRLTLCMHGGNAGPVSDRMHRDFDAMLPEIRNAAVLGFRHSTLLQDAFWEGLRIGRPHEYAFLIDERGRVMRQTDEADRLVRGGDGLGVRGGRLCACDPAQDNAVERIVARAVQAVGAHSGATRVARPSGKSDLILICYPLQRSARMLAPLSAAALAIVVDPAHPIGSARDLYAQAFGLTPREADFAAALVAGHSVESAASALALAMPTARTHLSRIFEKTGVSTQARLIALLGRIAPPH